MSIDELVTHYIALRRTLGARFRSQEDWLRSFCRAVGPQTRIAHIETKVVAAFLAGNGPVTSAWFKKYQARKGFFGFAISRGHLSAAPLPTVLPKHPPSFVPYIYTQDELRRLLDAIPSSQHYNVVIESDTLRAILLLLYGAGLRVGEALALSVADVDLPNALLTVRDTKFFKSRLVPIGQQLAGLLTEYARQRAGRHSGDNTESRFFLGRLGKPIPLRTIDSTFRRLREHACIGRSDGARYQPRLHDLRHSFAVHRLTEWYRQGADVQRLVHHLSVYLGHTSLAATQVYLTMTPELLRQVGTRFERYARGEGSHA
ncbi:MAG TPA: tyrosine-type recombinase/integrase [Gemmataceae bacterium]|nr:tyrosine-type recombinase/integrase [Gemmataceae bacterium]